MVQYKKGYKTLLNEEEGRGLFTVHIEATDEVYLRRIVLMKYDNADIVSFKETQLIDGGSIKVQDMVEGEEYLLLAETESFLDTVSFEKDKGKLFVKRTGQFASEQQEKSMGSYVYEIEEVLENLRRFYRKLVANKDNEPMDDYDTRKALELFEEEIEECNINSLTLERLEGLDWIIRKECL
ncbi:hypothetical protein GH891_31855, partial [Bacillus thuringiensis]|nr:hypothetical protein [Bacillus thuringiensis]